MKNEIKDIRQHWTFVVVLLGASVALSEGKVEMKSETLWHSVFYYLKTALVAMVKGGIYGASFGVIIGWAVKGAGAAVKGVTVGSLIGAIVYGVVGVLGGDCKS